MAGVQVLHILSTTPHILPNGSHFPNIMIYHIPAATFPEALSHALSLESVEYGLVKPEEVMFVCLSVRL